MVAGWQSSGAAGTSAAGPGRADRSRADRGRGSWPGGWPSISEERGCRATGDGGHRWPGPPVGGGPWPPKGGWCLLKTHRCPPAPTADDPGGRPAASGSDTDQCKTEAWIATLVRRGSRDDAMPGGLPDTGIACAYWTKSAPPTDGAEPVVVDRARAWRGSGQCSRESQEKSRDR